MDIKNMLNKVGQFFKKYRYAVLVLLIGIVLMMIPSGNSAKKSTTNNAEIKPTQSSLENQIQSVLSLVDGAGEVRVFLSPDMSEETIFQLDQDISISENTNTTHSNAVIIQDENRNETGLVRQTKSASYKGAIIVCQGADNSTVKLAIIDAVSKATGLGTDRISVLKMK